MFLRSAQARRSGSIALIQQVESVDRRAINFLGIRQDALLALVRLDPALENDPELKDVALSLVAMQRTK